MHCVAKSFKFGKKKIIDTLASKLNCFGRSSLNNFQFQNLEEITSENECCLLLISAMAEEKCRFKQVLIFDMKIFMSEEVKAVFQLSNEKPLRLVRLLWAK